MIIELLCVIGFLFSMWRAGYWIGRKIAEDENENM